MKFELMDIETQSAVIKVIGVGGGGGNAVNHMMKNNIDGVDYICANTDAQALNAIDVRTALQIGASLTGGLGAGANPQVGQQAAVEDKERIAEALKGSDMLFITAGMGGGTGTGAAPVVAEIAKEQGILTVAVVTKPFSFEGEKRMQAAEQGIEALSQNVDSLITIPNEKLLAVLGKSTTMLEAFKAANDVLLNAVQGIAELITNPGILNVDFADVRTVMSEMGMAMMGTGSAVGEDRARMAAEAAVNSPLLDDISLSGAKGLLINITAGLDMGIGEFDEVGTTIKEFAREDATVVVGTVLEPDMQDEIRVTVVATGLGEEEKVMLAKRDDSVVAPIRPVQEKSATDTEAPAISKSATGRFEGLDVPTSIRRNQEKMTTFNEPTEPPDMDYLDIPAFLRRQAD